MSRRLFLAGPTASGKSAVAFWLAERLGGEIITVDSMQVYRGLNIGTAKPSPADQTRVRHHLLDVMELNEPFDAAKFVQLAQPAAAGIEKRGQVAIFCGGTGLYFKACLEGLGEAPPADAKIRAELEAAPLTELLRELEQRDPATFTRIDQKNARRVIRALEVIRITGKPFSAQRAAWNKEGAETAPWPNYFALERTPEDLKQRIRARVDEMFARGLVTETEALLRRGLTENRTAMQAIGYRQVVEHLRGERSLPETIELVKTRTWQFARRQMTWFRKQARLRWIQVEPQATAEQVAAKILKV